MEEQDKTIDFEHIEESVGGEGEEADYAEGDLEEVEGEGDEGRLLLN